MQVTRIQGLAGLAALVVVVACTPAGETPGKAETKTETKAEGEAKAADAGAAKAADAGAAKAPAAGGPAAPKPPPTAGLPPPPVQEPPKLTFRKGQIAPKGLSVEDLLAWNHAQGDPIEGEFTLKEAFAGDEALADPKNGKLYAVFKTTMGEFACVLFDDKTPKTVASFVGLARGTRPWYDKKEDTWKTGEPYFNGVLFHRVIKNFMIQTGDRSGTGTGNPGFLIADEIDPALKHNKAGILSMANRGPNTGSSQFFVTVAATPHLDGKHAVFGQCEPKVPVKISEVKVKSLPGVDSRPLDDIKIESIAIERRKK